MPVEIKTSKISNSPKISSEYRQEQRHVGTNFGADNKTLIFGCVMIEVKLALRTWPVKTDNYTFLMQFWNF